jgi:hypothetical protein
MKIHYASSGGFTPCGLPTYYNTIQVTVDFCDVTCKNCRRTEEFIYAWKAMSDLDAVVKAELTVTLYCDKCGAPCGSMTLPFSGTLVSIVCQDCLRQTREERNR